MEPILETGYISNVQQTVSI